MNNHEELLRILKTAKELARDYRVLTGKPLGVTGEIAEYESSRILGLELTAARHSGYDAVEKIGNTTRRLQIKGRCLLSGCKPGQRLGSIKLDREWDAVLLVLLDEDFEATAIYEAERAAIEAAITAPGSKARNERGALAVNTFKRIGKLRWSRTI